MFTYNIRTKCLVILQIDSEDVGAQQNNTFILMFVTKSHVAWGASIKVSTKDSTNPQSLLHMPLHRIEQCHNTKSNSQLCLPKGSSLSNKISKGRKKGHQRLRYTNSTCMKVLCKLAMVIMKYIK